MPPPRFSCPQCGAVFKSARPTSSGKTARCRDCGAALDVTDRLDTDNASPWEDFSPTEPARKRRSRSRRRERSDHTALIVGVVVGAVLLVGGLAAGAVWFFKSGRLPTEDLPSSGWTGLGPRSVDDPIVTKETFEGLRAESSLPTLEVLLGPARKVSIDDLPLADQPTPGKEDRAKIRKLAQKYRIRSWYLWSGKNRWAFAGFRTGQSSIVAWHFRGPDGSEAGGLEDNENTLP
jgi:transcription elongation factor Elf1/uncharacterized membrane protein